MTTLRRTGVLLLIITVMVTLGEVLGPSPLGYVVCAVFGVAATTLLFYRSE